MISFKLRCIQPATSGLYSYVNTAISSTPQANDKIGWSMAMDYAGDRLVVGGINTNLAALFERDGSVWAFTQEWRPSAPPGIGIWATGFGYSVDISDDGNRIVIGNWAATEDIALPAFGGVYLYSDYGSGFPTSNNFTDTWSYAQSPHYAEGSEIFGWTGRSLSISGDGDNVFVGQPSHPNTGNYPLVNTYEGNVMVLPIRTVEGVDEFNLDVHIDIYAIPELDEYDVPENGFGWILKFSKDINPNVESNIGVVRSVYNGTGPYYIQYVHNVEGWGTYGGYYIPGGGNNYDYFGNAIAMTGDGSRIAVSAPGKNDDRLSPVAGCGKVYILAPTFGGSFSLVQTISPPIPEAGMWFGAAVAMSRDGSLLAIGAGDEDVNGTDSGAVYIYQWNGSGYILAQKIVPADGQAYDYFGYSIALSGDGTHLAISCLWDDGSVTNQGSIYFYSLT